ncbi:MAG: ribosome maturation factor RimP [Gammaproteobacteria bacterium]|nr:MAG: ribosome maturation factor RimP [Gammaproteobacteria bacterium]
MRPFFIGILNTVEDILRNLARQTAEGLGYEFVGIEYLTMGRDSLLRVYIDTDTGVTIDGCAEVSRQLSVVLDVEDPIPGNYTLEVSSPGLNRPLFSLEDYARFVQRRAKIRLRQMLDGRRNFKGRIEAVEADKVVLKDADGNIFHVPFCEIQKGHLLVD